MNTPDNITKLGPREIFVFGSNYAGRHGAGAARDALSRFGARSGQGAGMQGNSYGICTKGHHLEVLPLSAIEAGVDRFIRVARQLPDLRFLVTPIGCGLARYGPKDIAPMFAGSPGNVILPASFEAVLSETK